MVSEQDLIILPFTSDLIEAGIGYALGWLVQTGSQASESVWHKFNNIVICKAVELALRRYLTEQNVPTQTAAVVSLSNLGNHDLLIAGWRCIFQCRLLDQTHEIQRIGSTPSTWLQMAALVSADQIVAWVPGDKVLYIFAFVTATDALVRSQESACEQPGSGLMLLPRSWASPAAANLGYLTFQADGESTLHLQIGGRAPDQKPLNEMLTIQPGHSQTTRNPYRCLVYLHSRQLPSCRIGLLSKERHRSIVIDPKAWRNVWVDGQTIILAGYMRHPEFSRRSRRQTDLTARNSQQKYRMLTIGELHSLHELMELARSHI